MQDIHAPTEKGFSHNGSGYSTDSRVRARVHEVGQLPQCRVTVSADQ